MVVKGDGKIKIVNLENGQIHFALDNNANVTLLDSAELNY